MKLIMENWRGYLNEIDANGNPETVGELLIAINKYTMIQGDVAKRILNNVIEVLKVVVDSAQEEEFDLEEDIGKLIEWFEEILEADRNLEGAREAILAIPTKAVISLISKNPIKDILIKKIGMEALEFLVGDIIPGAAMAIKFTKWFVRIFKLSKEVKQAIDTAKAGPKQVFAMIVKDIYDAKDNKDTTRGFMKIFNVDDKWSEMLEDKIEMKFLEKQMGEIESMPPDTPLENLNFNAKLVEFLEDIYQNRTVAGSPFA
jgi:hypothetical protein